MTNRQLSKSILGCLPLVWGVCTLIFKQIGNSAGSNYTYWDELVISIAVVLIAVFITSLCLWIYYANKEKKEAKASNVLAPRDPFNWNVLFYISFVIGIGLVLLSLAVIYILMIFTAWH